MWSLTLRKPGIPSPLIRTDCSNQPSESWWNRSWQGMILLKVSGRSRVKQSPLQRFGILPAKCVLVTWAGFTNTCEVFESKSMSQSLPYSQPEPAREKRNQGLFYTPHAVVKHIVTSTLDALNITSPEQWLDVRLVDPAVGTGVFLAEAMDQVAQRILYPGGCFENRPFHRILSLRKGLQDRARDHGIAVDPDDEAAVRVHLVETCLYGIDIDGIALSIARVELLDRAFCGFPMVPDVMPLLRIGNALVGRGVEASSLTSLDEKDLDHATAWFGLRSVPKETVRDWRDRIGVFHWSTEFPEVFDRARGGFDAVISNPPYEVVSSKESGIEERSRHQAYFRRTYACCSGKINTYRLMLERGLTVLRDGGVLGFIMPATLLADSTAGRLRRTVLDGTEVIEAMVIPEKARVFDRVTQALLILVVRKGERTEIVPLAFWDGNGALGNSEIFRSAPTAHREDGFSNPSHNEPRRKGTSRMPDPGASLQGGYGQFRRGDCSPGRSEPHRSSRLHHR